jgi:hypothetical protein
MGMMTVGGLYAHLAHRARPSHLAQQSPHALFTHLYALSLQGFVQLALAIERKTQQNLLDGL